MIRRFLSLAWEALKEEGRRWRDPYVEEEPTVPVRVQPPVQVQKVPAWRTSPAGHVQMLDSLQCECGSTKAKGSYFCRPCIAKLAAQGVQ